MKYRIVLRTPKGGHMIQCKPRFWPFWSDVYIWPLFTLDRALEKVEELKQEEAHKSKVVWP